MKKIKLTIGSGSDYRYAVKVSIFDPFGVLISEFNAAQVKTFDIDEGIYTIRLELYGVLKDEMVRLCNDEEFIALRMLPKENEKELIWPEARILTLPLIYSAIPFADTNYKTYASTEAYYLDAALEYSQKSTASEDQDEGNSLFILLRFPNKEKFDNTKQYWPGGFERSFSLLKDTTEKLLDIESSNASVDLVNGYIAFNIRLGQGGYFIRVASMLGIQLIPVYVFSGWHTQVFLTLSDRPLFSSLRTILSRERKFEPEGNVLNKYSDILVDKIQNNDNSITDEIIQFVSSNEYESPMLALLCIYAYMNGNSDAFDAQIGAMIAQLQSLAVDNKIQSPDLQAINLLAEMYLNQPNEVKGSISGVPMLRIGLESINDAAVKYPNLIQRSSVLDFAMERMNKSAAFTFFDWYDDNKVIQANEVEYQINANLAELLPRIGRKHPKAQSRALALITSSEEILRKLEEENKIKVETATYYRKAIRFLKGIFGSDMEVQGPITSVNERLVEVAQDNPQMTENFNRIMDDPRSSDIAIGVASYLMEHPEATEEQTSVDLKVPQAIVSRIFDNMNK
jgi:hypothetical protein